MQVCLDESFPNASSQQARPTQRCQAQTLPSPALTTTAHNNPQGTAPVTQQSKHNTQVIAM
jgi:hypothetical protein